MYKYEQSCLISPETFYFTFAERKEFAALDFLEGPVALALDSALLRLHERATREYTGCGRSEQRTR